MTPNKYQVEVVELKEIHEMPGAWTNVDLIGLLQHIEFDDAETIPEEELKEMTAMALSDLEVEEAAIAVLEYRMGERLNKGQRLNLAEELKDDRIWEEYSDISLHEELFNVSCMLYWSFPKQFSEPDIVRIRLKVTSMNYESKSNLENSNESFLCRLLNDGMDDRNLIVRLFEEGINSNSFPEAKDILWKFEADGFSEEDKSNTFTIYTSWNWVDELKSVNNYESRAYCDGQLS
ncbi:MAG: hypothetical protein KJO23_07875 [Bacteroidia bacterium]|nr:hypothetical protein [Bacteroidia bacterium]